ncbi:aldehyde dehydrogenase (NADP(+)) [Cupriavidus necator]|uniref:2,5-dioxovalerate dehydrogenase n=1 Tax=Cupriavidus necator TaxID=106590 RepID=A0A1U9V494_CUPNE|nr:aldehyde dehydrogenase (NADP(+)) [Cupriavidus necator]AQV99321.1 aldehyde dehydrogenase (NADP(+)) [Cupriavidus necator]
MRITGHMLIGQGSVSGTAGAFKALSPALAADIEPAFGGAAPADVDQACRLAASGFARYRETTPETRASFLEAIATGIEGLGDDLIERAMAETALPRARLEGERARTAGQLRLFAGVVRAGHWHGATLDTPLPDRTPLPRPDLRRRNVPLGPVAIFGASNFPLAFSVAGGDTASALAAGCPVVVKAHPAHPGTSELVGRVIQAAVAEYGLPEGTFSLLFGVGNDVGQALVGHPAIRAVGFTGSRAGGLALLRQAMARPLPIPVYAEMSSVNPVLLLPHALVDRAEGIAREFVDSLVMGVGQFCTNPGLVIALEGDDCDRFEAEAGRIVQGKPAGTMLTPGIGRAYAAGVAHLRAHEAVRSVATGESSSGACAATAHLFATDAASFLAFPELGDEIFGPCSLIVRCRSAADMAAVLDGLEGQLTATLQMAPADEALAAELLPRLEDRAGRILVNGFPTGVEVSHAMVHGGPFPATSDARSTSVGSAAIERFLRPVCYQNFPSSLMPAALADFNPLALDRHVDGSLSPPSRRD